MTKVCTQLDILEKENRRRRQGKTKALENMAKDTQAEKSSRIFNMVKKKEKKKIRSQKNNETFVLEKRVSSKNENI